MRQVIVQFFRFGQLSNLAKPVVKQGLNILFPPRCATCGVACEAPHTLCPACWGKLHFITNPQCSCCGHPFGVAVQDDMLCGACLRELPLYAKARAPLHYDEHSKNHVLGLKFYDRTDALPLFAEWMKSFGSACLEGADLLVPVPLHRFRLWRRRYNQAALLAYGLSKITSIPVIPDALLRVKHTTPQSDLTRLQRLENVIGAFRVNEKYAARISGSVIVLIDDVMTTGATLKECTKKLLKAGAKEVRVLTLARTVVGE